MYLHHNLHDVGRRCSHIFKNKTCANIFESVRFAFVLCCLFQSPSFKFSRKASSSYSLKLDPPNKQSKIKTRRKPLSTPASPNRSREPQCTCMTADQYARLKAQDPRFRGTDLYIL